MYLKAIVTTGAKKEKILAKKLDHFEISVKEKAERNMANTRIISIFKSIFKTNDVRIINGHNSPSKLLSVGVE